MSSPPVTSPVSGALGDDVGREYTAGGIVTMDEVLNSKPADPDFAAYDSRPPRTKVVCSVRASTDEESIKQLILAGMNVAHLNLARGNKSSHEKLMRRIRRAADATKHLCAVVVSPRGAQVYTGALQARLAESRRRRSRLVASDKLGTPKFLPHPKKVTSTQGKEHRRVDPSASAGSLSLSSSTLQLKTNLRPPTRHTNTNMNPSQAQNLFGPVGMVRLSNDLQRRDSLSEFGWERDEETSYFSDSESESEHYSRLSMSGRLNEDESSSDKSESPGPSLPPVEPARSVGSEPMEEKDFQQAVTTAVQLAKEDEEMEKQEHSYSDRHGPVVPMMPGISGDETDTEIGTPRAEIFLLRPGMVVTVATNKLVKGVAQYFSIIRPNLRQHLKKGAIICIGPSIRLEYVQPKDKEPESLLCKVVHGGRLEERLPVSFEGCEVPPLINPQSLTNDIVWAAKVGYVDYVALPCVEDAKAVEDARHVVEASALHVDEFADEERIGILATVETEAGAAKLEDILYTCDGVVVDLNALSKCFNEEELRAFRAFAIQRGQCHARPVVFTSGLIDQVNKEVSTKLLPRAEMAQIADAVSLGVDAIFFTSELSGNSAKVNPTYSFTEDGFSVNFALSPRQVKKAMEPVEVLRKLCKSLRQYEVQTNNCALFRQAKSLHLRPVTFKDFLEHKGPVLVPSDDWAQVTPRESIASSTVKTVLDLDCRLVIVLTRTGLMPRVVAKFRPNCNILTITDNERVANQCMLVQSALPVLVLSMTGVDSLIARAVRVAQEAQLIKKGEKFVVTAGSSMNDTEKETEFILKIVTVRGL